jgi:hypothetical protein
MTEAEWDKCAESSGMFRALYASLPRERVGPGPRVGFLVRTPERKMRLFAVALGRCLQWVYRHEWHRMALDATEEVADDEGREEEVRRTLSQLHEDMNRPQHPDNPHLDAVVWHAALPHEFWEATEALMVACVRALRAAWGNRKPPVPAQADILREIFGNPSRPVAFSPAWRTDTAMSLAKQMYESREFSAMPILADALQDAGCDSDELLNHLRDTGAAHVRGCWALDLVLGKA